MARAELDDDDGIALVADVALTAGLRRGVTTGGPATQRNWRAKRSEESRRGPAVAGATGFFLARPPNQVLVGGANSCSSKSGVLTGPGGPKPRLRRGALLAR